MPRPCASSARFRLKTAFADEALGRSPLLNGIIHDEPMFRVTTAIVEHRTPCLAFALEEAAHVNIWKNRLVDRGLPVGRWLRDLKRAVVENRPTIRLLRSLKQRRRRPVQCQSARFATSSPLRGAKKSAM